MSAPDRSSLKPGLPADPGVAPGVLRADIDPKAHAVMIDFDCDSSQLSGDEVAAQCVRHIFLATNWDRRVASDVGIEHLIEDGYSYNSWPKRN